jgi:hypothetical protein
MNIYLFYFHLFSNTLLFPSNKSSSIRQAFLFRIKLYHHLVFLLPRMT